MANPHLRKKRLARQRLLERLKAETEVQTEPVLVEAEETAACVIPEASDDVKEEEVVEPKKSKKLSFVEKLKQSSSSGE